MFNIRDKYYIREYNNSILENSNSILENIRDKLDLSRKCS